MRRLLPLLLLSLPPAPSRADEEHGERRLHDLNAAVARAVRTAGPSIACILVSRSDDYQNAPHWGVAADPDKPGQLGRFDAASARAKVPDDAPRRSRLLRAIGQLDLSDANAVPESYGSGLVVDRGGLVLTNAHVVKNASKIYVRLPGKGKRGSWADIHASDPRSDLAVLKLLDPPADLRALELGDGGSVGAGRFVISLANSYAPGFKSSAEPTADWGLVKKLRQKLLEGKQSEMDVAKKTLAHYGALIQTDAKTTPGCSGGALLDLNGKVIGLTTALAAVSGSQVGGFAMPFDENTRRIIAVLKRGEEVEYGFLGVYLNDAGGNGVRITRVSPGSPAWRAGIKDNDHIVSVDGSPIRENDDLFLHIGMALAGRTVRVEVTRGNFLQQTQTQKSSVTLGKFDVLGPIIASKRPPARFGLRVDHTTVLSQRNPFSLWNRALPEGVVVREVVPDSPAQKARFDATKVITHVNGQAVSTPAEFYREMAGAGKQVVVTYLDSGGRPLKLTLEEK